MRRRDWGGNRMWRLELKEYTLFGSNKRLILVIENVSTFLINSN